MILGCAPQKLTLTGKLLEGVLAVSHFSFRCLIDLNRSIWANQCVRYLLPILWFLFRPCRVLLGFLMFSRLDSWASYPNPYHLLGWAVRCGGLRVRCSAAHDRSLVPASYCYSFGTLFTPSLHALVFSFSLRYVSTIFHLHTRIDLISGCPSISHLLCSLSTHDSMRLLIYSGCRSITSLTGQSRLTANAATHG